MKEGDDMKMKMISPVSDLRNNFADISKTVYETKQPVFLTKKGSGDMVVLSMEAFEKMQFDRQLRLRSSKTDEEVRTCQQTVVFASQISTPSCWQNLDSGGNTRNKQKTRTLEK